MSASRFSALSAFIPSVGMSLPASKILSSPLATPLLYTTQTINVWGSPLRLMHPAEERVSVAKGMMPWSSQPHCELLAEKAIRGDLKRYQHPVTPKTGCVWLPTVEAQGYIKAGGLAEVPVGLARSFQEAHGFHPYLVMPLYVGTQRVQQHYHQHYLQHDASTLVKGEEGYVYCMDVLNKAFEPVDQTKTPLKRVFQFAFPVADLERTPDSDEVTLVLQQTHCPYQTMHIEVFQGELEGLPLILLHHRSEGGDRSFFDISTSRPMKSPSPYVGSRFAEIRRFTFFTRALNELQWALTEHRIQHGTAPLRIPEALLLNDWQVGALAALTRYSAYYQAEDRLARQVQRTSPFASPSSKRLQQAYETAGHFFARQQQHHVLIHNFAYQGEHPNHRLGDLQKTEYLYNLLFDKYAARIMKYAHGLNDATLPPRLMKNLTLENRFNLLRMAVGTADTLVAVSPNYAKELNEQEALAGVMHPLLQKRWQYGTLKGITNGYDKDKLLPTTRWITQHLKPYPELLPQLQGQDAAWQAVQTSPQGQSNRALVFGSLTPQAEATALAVRRHNRACFRSVLQNLPEAVYESLWLKNLTDASVIDAAAPIFYTVGRLVEQKGFDQFALATEQFWERWQAANDAHRAAGNETPLPLPGFVVQGSGDDAYRRPWVELKERLAYQRKAKRPRSILLLDTPDAALKDFAMLGCDYFVVPSKFEPCGLVQMEALACGTPVVAMAVGGLVDTITPAGAAQTGFLTEQSLRFDTHTSEAVQHNASLLAESLWQAYETYVHRHAAYEAMCLEALSQNFSWSMGPYNAYAGVLSLSS